jgi:hypothetical protein
MVVVLSFTLLMIRFGILAIPVTATIMILLFAATAFGVVVAVLQWGCSVSLALVIAQADLQRYEMLLKGGTAT